VAGKTFARTSTGYQDLKNSNLTVQKLRRFMNCWTNITGRNYPWKCVILTRDNTNFCLSVHDQVEWVQVSELLSYKLAPADIPIAEKVRNKYG